MAKSILERLKFQVPTQGNSSTSCNQFIINVQCYTKTLSFKLAAFLSQNIYILKKTYKDPEYSPADQ